MTTNLVTWLRQQLDTDAQEIAKHPDDADYMGGADLFATEESNYPSLPYLQISKKRALAEVDAKRRILDLHQCAGRLTGSGYPQGGFAWCATCGSGEANEYPTDWPCDTLKLLALPYADRPGYRDEWRP